METKAYYLEEAARHLKAANEAMAQVNDPAQGSLHSRTSSHIVMIPKR